jgi:hypothetical protein
MSRGKYERGQDTIERESQKRAARVWGGFIFLGAGEVAGFVNTVLTIRGPHKALKVRGWVTRRTLLQRVSVSFEPAASARNGAVLGRVAFTSIVRSVII